MTNLEKYNVIFKENLEVKDEQLNSELIYQSVQEWDSVGHMGLMSAIEDEFDIMLETDDIIDFNSYEEGKKILRKYDIEI